MTLKAENMTTGNQVNDGVVTTRVKSVLLSDPAVKSVDNAVEGMQNVTNQMSIKNSD